MTANAKRAGAAVFLGVALLGVLLWSRSGSTKPTAYEPERTPTGPRSAHSQARGGRASAICDHPYLPTGRTWTARFLVTREGRGGTAAGPASATSAWTLERWTQVDGALELELRIDFEGRTLGNLRRRCNEAGVGDPWFGFLPGIDGIVQGEDIWQIPRELRPGDAFGGETTLTTRVGRDRGPTTTIRRDFLVGEPELVGVPAGRYTTIRIDVAELATSGERVTRRSGAIWLALDVGLVKSRMEGRSGGRTVELSELSLR